MAGRIVFEHYFLLVMLVVLSIGGVIGNSLVLVVYRVKKDYSVSTFFIKVLALVDLSTCLFIIPATVYMEYRQFIIWNDIGCKVYHFMITCNIPFSALVMVAIAIERYICICHPFAEGLNLPRAKLLTLLLLLCSTVFGIITSLLYGNAKPTETAVQNNTATEGNTSSTKWAGTTVAPSKAPPHPIHTNVFIHSLEGASSETVVGYNISMVTRPDSQAPAVVIFPPEPGECALAHDLLPLNFVLAYQKVYSAVFLIAFCIIVILYALIYRSVVMHRSRNRRRRQSNGVHAETVELNQRNMEQSQLCDVTAGTTTTDADSCPTNGRLQRRYSFLRDRNRVANIKTAAILFVVTIVFMLSYLPSWIMAHAWIQYNPIVFYMYFLNNVANPIIYAFMNRNFRTNLQEALTWYKRHKADCCCPMGIR